MNTPPFTLDDNERIIRTIHRHWIDLLSPLLAAGVLFLASLGVFYLGIHFGHQTSIPGSFIALVGVLIFMIAILVGVVGVFVFRRNVMILTNLHLVQVEQNGLFNRRVSQLSLVKVQDVTGMRPGMLATILDFGDLEIQSAGEQEKFTFHNAPGPEQLADECLAAHEVCMRERAEQGISEPTE